MDDPDHPSSRPLAPDPEPVRRTAEIEDVTNIHVVHAISNRLTPVLARLHVHPNAVSVAGMVFGVAAGFAYSRFQNPGFAIAGFLLMIAWHVMDGTDGQLARLTGSQSQTGKVLDGICDYVTFGAVYLALAITLGRLHGDLVWLLVIAAGLCHAVQSAAYEAQRQDYDRWAWGRTPVERPGASIRARTPHLAGSLHRLYARVQAMATDHGRDHQELDRILRSRRQDAASIRRRYRSMFARPIRRWSVLSANTRTIGIFLCALLDLPMFYFLFEIVGLSLILAILTSRQRARFARFVDQVRA